MFFQLFFLLLKGMYGLVQLVDAQIAYLPRFYAEFVGETQPPSLGKLVKFAFPATGCTRSRSAASSYSTSRAAKI